MQYFQKKRLIENTDNDKSFTATYKLMINGKPVHVGLKAVRLDDKDGHHILIGIRNIDDQMKREKYYIKALSDAQNLANQDTLTGVKNKRAYDEKEKSLNAAIAAKESPEFAVVVCDVNDLKAINDKNGHKAGDARIKEAAETVCTAEKDGTAIPVPTGYGGAAVRPADDSVIKYHYTDYGGTITDEYEYFTGENGGERTFSVSIVSDADTLLTVDVKADGYVLIVNGTEKGEGETCEIISI